MNEVFTTKNLILIVLALVPTPKGMFEVICQFTSAYFSKNPIKVPLRAKVDRELFSNLQTHPNIGCMSILGSARVLITFQLKI